MLGINWIEWLGYISSVIVFISLTTSSIIRLRIISLVGSMLFSTYGFLIHSIPTGVMNAMVCGVNIYYLAKMFKHKEDFVILKTQKDDQYLIEFFKYYRDEILKSFPDFEMVNEDSDISFYVLRDMVTAGLFLGKRLDEESLLITLDFAIPEYRDFKIGKHIYMEHEKLFTDIGYKRLLVKHSRDNIDYLKKMGFIEDPANKEYLIKSLAL